MHDEFPFLSEWPEMTPRATLSKQIPVRFHGVMGIVLRVELDECLIHVLAARSAWKSRHARARWSSAITNVSITSSVRI
jgi:hypothetical protein